MIRFLRPILLAAFLTSGATSLVYEILWTRHISAWFGISAYAMATTLSAFMVGLAGGSWLGTEVLRRRWIDPLRGYALAEVGIAICAVLLQVVFLSAEPAMAGLARTFPGTSLLALTVRFVVLGAMLLPPTVLMGATFPLFTQGLVRLGGSSRRIIGQAYGLNVLGAAVGCGLTGAVLLGSLGITRSVILAAILNLATALVAWVASRRIPDGPQATAPASPRLKGWVPSPAIVYALVGASGLAIMASEVVWSRLYRQALYLANPFHAFALVLTIILLGMGLGSLLVERLGRRWSPARLLLVFGILQGILALLVIPALSDVRWWAVTLLDPWFGVHNAAGHGIPDRELRRALSLMVLAASAITAGACFPVLGAVHARDPARLGLNIGRLFAMSTLGGVLGSLAGGFLLVPGLGVRLSLLLLGLIHASCATIACWGRLRLRALVVGGLLVVVLDLGLVFTTERAEFGTPPHVVYFNDGLEATTVVTVSEDPHGSTQLYVNGMSMAGKVSWERVLVPLALAPRHDRVLLIGFGTGLSAAICWRSIPRPTWIASNWTTIKHKRPSFLIPSSCWITHASPSIWRMVASS